MTSERFMPGMLLPRDCSYPSPWFVVVRSFCVSFFWLLCWFMRAGWWGSLFGLLLLFVCGTAGWGMAEWKGGHAASACDVQHRERLESGLLCVFT